MAIPGNAPPPGAGDFHLTAFTCWIGTLLGRALFGKKLKNLKMKKMKIMKNEKMANTKPQF